MMSEDPVSPGQSETTPHPEAAPGGESRNARANGGFLETVKAVVFAIVIAMGIRTFAFEPFNIPSGSMIPTLLVGDYLFVSKYSYGYSRFSAPLGLPLFSGRIAGKMPERGDVVVFKLPRDNSTDYIKRVIGLPGDTIQMIRGLLYINGKPVKRERIEDYHTTDALGRSRSVIRYMETLPNGVVHPILEENGDNGPLDDTDVYTVPPDHLFMMGDNRDNSLDSRVLNDVGYVPFENLVGKAQFLFFSLDGGAAFYEIWRWPFELRFSRLLQEVR